MEAQRGRQLILVKMDAGGRFVLRCLLFLLEGQRSYQPLQLCTQLTEGVDASWDPPQPQGIGVWTPQLS